MYTKLPGTGCELYRPWLMNLHLREKQNTRYREALVQHWGQIHRGVKNLGSSTILYNGYVINAHPYMRKVLLSFL